jgi:hypothetical protein
VFFLNLFCTKKQIHIFAAVFNVLFLSSPDGGIGRRAGLKNQWEFSLAGSIPAPGTKTERE